MKISTYLMRGSRVAEELELELARGKGDRLLVLTTYFILSMLLFESWEQAARQPAGRQAGWATGQRAGRQV